MKRLLLWGCLPVLLLLSSCGGGGSTTTTTTPTITVSPTSASLNANATLQFTATIANLSSTLVNWQVNSVAGGNSTVGTIDATGLYKAPTAVPATNVVTITAVAQAQTSLTATASVTILPPASIAGITPNGATVAAGTSQAFTATVSGGGSLAVFWFINNSATCSSTLGVQGGTSTTGIITPQGNYTAPQIPPPGGAIAITAVSQTDSTQTFCVPVTLTFGNASLQGSYAFSTSGRVISGNTAFARAGSFTASGSGALINGLEDSNQLGTDVQHNFTGTYSIGADGRGTMQFCEDIGTPCTAAAATVFFRIAVFSAQQAQIIEFSSPTTSTALTVAGGEMNLQDTTILSTSALSGTYSFKFSGATQSDAGEFVSNGLGVILSGQMDINAGGPQNILATSTYSINSNGRGSASIVTSGGTLTFSVYIVNASRAKFIETDASAVVVGDAFKQQTSSCTWGAASLNGPTLFETGGIGTNGGIGDLVSFTSDGNGNVVPGSGMIDENSGGIVTSTPSLSGAYTIAPCGRGTLGISSHTYVFYMISTSSAVIQETTAGVVAHGFLIQPQGGPFTATSLKGSYALSLAGTNAAGTTGKRDDILGQLTASGVGTVTSGSLDINNFGATQAVTPNVGTYTSVAVNGRTTVLLNPTRNFVLYLVSPTQVFVLGADTTNVAVGSLFKQF